MRGIVMAQVYQRVANHGSAAVRVGCTIAVAVALAAISLAQVPAAPPTPARGQGAGQPGQPGPGALPGARQGGAPGGGGRGGPAFAGPALNVLVVSGGCCHDYPSQDRILYDILNKVAPINWTFALGMTNLPDGRLPLYADPNYGNKFDLIVHNECWANGDFPPQFLQNIVAPHMRGTPALVFHCSLHSYRSAPDGQDFWREMLGVTSHRHTRAHEIEVKWSDDPITKDLPSFKTPTDELYVIEKSWPGTKALATAINDVDQGVSGAAGTISNDVYPVVWSHEFSAEKGGARTFGTSLGHGNDGWNTPQFQELVIRGFRWAMRRDPLAPWPTAAAGQGGAPGGGRGRGGDPAALPAAVGAPTAPAPATPGRIGRGGGGR